MHTGIVDPVAAKRIGAKVLPEGVSYQGWTLLTRKGAMIGEKEVEKYRAKLDNVLSLPEILFGNSRVRLIHEATGLVIDFNAYDALRGWREENLPSLQVKVANDWQKARQQEIALQNAVRLEWDWTFTTPYQGSLRQRAAHAEKEAADAPSVSGLSPPPMFDEESDLEQYTGPSWETTTEQIDRALLMEREPILFYDEVPLYESDLDDNGVTLVTVKLRAMPKCWLVLLRFWLRVDGVLVRLRETRLFCRYDRPGADHTIIREVKHFEGTFTDLRAAGAPGESGGSYASADSAAEVFNAIAPTGLKLFKLDKLVLPSGSPSAGSTLGAEAIASAPDGIEQ